MPIPTPVTPNPESPHPPSTLLPTISDFADGFVSELYSTDPELPPVPKTDPETPDPEPALMELPAPAAPLMFSGVPSLGGVGGKLNAFEVAMDVAGCTERGAVGLGWLSVLFEK